MKRREANITESLKKSSYKHEWVAKAEWRATALRFKIEAHNEKQAWHRAWGKVSRMEGGAECLKVILERQIR
jgi:hypothetical protein